MPIKAPAVAKRMEELSESSDLESSNSEDEVVTLPLISKKEASSFTVFLNIHLPYLTVHLFSEASYSGGEFFSCCCTKEKQGVRQL
jgi:hypothetical protein